MDTAKNTLDNALSPQAMQFAHAFERLIPGEKMTIALLLDLLADPAQRPIVEALVRSARSMDDFHEIVRTHYVN